MIAATLPVRRTRAILLSAALLWSGNLWAPGTAQAAACSGGSGVTVVVDYGPYGGIETGCSPDPTNGLSALSQAGFAVVQVSSQPGFVCRIDGAPPVEDDACVRTPPASASWSYWQAAPGSTSWTYSGSGAGSTQPADGSTEGWSFGNIQAPGISPPANVAPPPSTTGRPPPPTGADPTSPGAPTATGGGRTTTPARTDSSAGTSAGSTSRGSTSTSPGASTPAASSRATSVPTSTADSAGSVTSGGSGQAVGSDAVREPFEPAGGAPWGVLAAAVVAVALGSGAYWQIRRRR